VRYRIGVDIGGTFTDCVVADADGGRSVSKALTTPGSLQDGVLEAVRLNAEQLGCSRAQLLADTELFVHGTTQATNAMITRTGARTGLITTRGHEDAIIIGKVFSKVAGLPERDLVRSSRLRKPEPIVPRGLIRGVTERIDREGEVLVALDEDEVVAAVDGLLAEGVEAIAVSLLWSFANDAHERRIREIIADRAPGVFTAYSHEIAPVLGEYERTSTTAVTAYVGPKVVAYLQTLESLLREDGLSTPMLVMQASGGLTSVVDAAQRPIVTLDSGPTGGILGCQHLGRLSGDANVICTDVGGTSFDVGLILRGDVPLQEEPVVSQYVLRLPKILVNSIGSGGGSIAWLDEGDLLRVGPQSAGSRPGPACYGLGGTDATVTDADLVLGYLDAESFLGGRMRLDRDKALAALARLGARLGMEPEEVARGVFRIINSQMADLIRKSTIEQGHDPRDCVLVAYGGAGPTHAVFYSHAIGARALLVPADSTVFSAEGMLTCDVTHTFETSAAMGTPFSDEDLALMTERFQALEEKVHRQFALEGAPAEDITVQRRLGVRYGKQVHAVDVDVDPGPVTQESAAVVLDRFVERYAQVYGRGALLPGVTQSVEIHRVTGTRPIEPIGFREHELEGPDPADALKGEREVHFEPAGFIATRVYDGDGLCAGNVVEGPAIIERMGDSVVVPIGYQAAVDRHLTLRLHPVAEAGAGVAELAERMDVAR
jgi:N-methylhydantoinase A